MRKTTKYSLALGIVALSAVAGWSLLGHRTETKSETDPKETKSAQSKGSNTANSSWNQPMAGGTSSRAPREMAMTPDQVRVAWDELYSIIADRKTLFERYGKSDRKRYREEMTRLRKAEQDLQHKLRAALAVSDEARKELLNRVMQEKDPLAKRELAQYIHTLPPELREPMELKLVASPTPEDRMEGIRGLATMGTTHSLKTIVDRGQVDDSPDVRRSAVMTVGQSLTKSSAANSSEIDDVRYRATAKTALRQFTNTEHPTEVRIAAFQSLATQREIAPSDQQMFARALSSETDPKVKSAIQFANNVALARQGKLGQQPKSVTR